MNFKEQVAADISAVFLNPDEFGEAHVIDGKSVTCVIDQNTDGKLVGDTEGLFVVTKRIMVRDGYLAKEPRQGKQIMVDNTPYTCLSISHEIGLLSIIITEDMS